MTTGQMDWLDDQRRLGHLPKPAPIPRVEFKFDSDPDVASFFDDLWVKLRDEDARMRSQVLPSPPVGWEWHAELRAEEDEAGLAGAVRVRLVYTIRQVTP